MAASTPAKDQDPLVGRGLVAGMSTVDEPPAEIWRRAGVRVCAHAADEPDAAMLLDMLGITRALRTGKGVT